jgi:moderate conductance mechanosensitive channel
MRPKLIGLVLLLLVPCRVLAQPPPAASASGLTPAQARAALDVLNDPKKRADVTATLEAIAKAQPLPATAAARPPADQAAPAKLPIPLAPHSLGAEVLVGAAAFLNHLSTDATNALHAMQSVPLLWGWIVLMATAPWARDLLLDVAWRVAVAVLCGLAVEYGLRRLVQGPIAALEALAPASGPPRAGHDTAVRDTPDEPDASAEDTEEDTEADAGEETEAEADAAPEVPPPAPESPAGRSEVRDIERAEAGDIEPRMRRRRRLPAGVLLRRVPLVLARLVLDLVPVVGFALAGHLVAGSPIGDESSRRLVILAVVDAYATCIALLSVASMLLSPRTSRLRLFNLPDTLAAYLMRWTRRLVVIAVFGYAAAEVGLVLGLSDAGHDAVLKASGFVLHACLVVIVLQKRRAVRRWLRSPPGATGAAARVRDALAAVWHWIALFFIVATWLVWAVEIPDGFSRLLHFCIVTAMLLIGARLLLILLIGGLDRALNVPPETAARYPGLETRLRRYHPALGALLRAAVYALCVLAILQLYGFGTLTWFGESDLGHRIVSALGTMAVTFLLALAAWEGTNAAIQQHLSRLAQDQQVVRSARLRTLLPLMRSTLAITILVVAGMMVLSQIGINIAPLLAGAGIIGVAIGFGSQKLVQDLITGIFLLLENAMQVGDFVTVSGLSGTVENLSVRTIRLRAGDGSVHVIPFSSVTTVTNVNRGLGNASVSVTVAYEEDTDHVAAVLTEIVAGMRAEQEFGGKMVSELQLWGVDKVDGAGVTIAGQVVCTDSGRWSVQREFNRRMKKRFQELGIQLFNPMHSVTVTLPSIGLSAGPSPGAAEEERAHEQSRAAD